MRHSCPKSGFTLVELSIVLVILGLLVGGVLSGRALIRAAELRNVTVEYQQFEMALNNFRGKYNALPGDFNKAIQFWGDADNPPSSPTGNETVNGNASGAIDFDEQWLYWQHLSNARLIEGRYSGTVSGLPVPGTDMPASKAGSGGSWLVSTGRDERNSGNTSNIWLLTAISDPDLAAVLTPEELWGIDTKMDDGAPLTGVVQGIYSMYGCIDDSVTPIAYNLGNSDVSCIVSFPRKEHPSSDWGFSGTEGESFSAVADL